MKRPKLILASKSPSRKNILEQLGLNFFVHESRFDERMLLKENESFEQLALYNARRKAEAVARKNKNSIIIGADTFCVIDTIILGKPYTKEKSIEYLTMLSSKHHRFYTAIVVIDTQKNTSADTIVHTDIEFRNLTQKEIGQYVNSEDATKAAGAYKTDGLGVLFVKKISGDFYAPAGLSPVALIELFEKLGYDLYTFRFSPLLS